MRPRSERRYDAPRTPFERVCDSPHAIPAAVAQLTALRARLDPFALAQAIDRKLERIYALAHHPARASAPLSTTVGPVPPAAPVVPRPSARRRCTLFGTTFKKAAVARKAQLRPHHPVTP